MAKTFAEYNDKELQDFVNLKFPALMAAAIGATATALWGHVKEEAPVDEGRLQGSFQLRQLGTLAWGITSNAEYRWIVHDGRGEIVAAPGKALRFEIAGQVLYRKRVGPAAGNPFYERAIKTTNGEVPTIVAGVLEGVG